MTDMIVYVYALTQTQLCRHTYMYTYIHVKYTQLALFIA